MNSFLEKYLNRELTFTKLIPELAKPLSKNKALILANLLTKMETLNSTETVHRIYGKEYHFYYSKKDIARKELLIEYRDFNENMKGLKEYVSEFSGRKKGVEGYNTTYFFLHRDKIRDLFDEGAKMLGKPIRILSDGKEQKQKTPKSNISKGLPYNVSKLLQSLNETEKKHRNGEVSEMEYKHRCLEVKGLIRKNKFNLIKNNELWEIIP